MTNKYRAAVAVIAAASLFTFGAHSVSAQNANRHETMAMQHSDQNYQMKSMHRRHYHRSAYSNVVIGGSYGSQSAYNNHQHHSYVNHRKYYDYNGDHYYIDLDTGLRFRI